MTATSKEGNLASSKDSGWRTFQAGIERRACLWVSGHCLSFVASSPSRAHKSPEQIASEPKPLSLGGVYDNDNIREDAKRQSPLAMGLLPIPGAIYLGEHGGATVIPLGLPQTRSGVALALEAPRGFGRLAGLYLTDVIYHIPANRQCNASNPRE